MPAYLHPAKLVHTLQNIAIELLIILLDNDSGSVGGSYGVRSFACTSLHFVFVACGIFMCHGDFMTRQFLTVITLLI